MLNWKEQVGRARRRRIGGIPRIESPIIFRSSSPPRRNQQIKANPWANLHCIALHLLVFFLLFSFIFSTSVVLFRIFFPVPLRKRKPIVSTSAQGGQDARKAQKTTEEERLANEWKLLPGNHCRFATGRTLISLYWLSGSLFTHELSFEREELVCSEEYDISHKWYRSKIPITWEDY